MSEQPQNPNDSTSPYDPDQDPDTQPGSLHPRSGDQARESWTEDYEDTDADPANLNPRSTEGDAPA